MTEACGLLDLLSGKHVIGENGLDEKKPYFKDSQNGWAPLNQKHMRPVTHCQPSLSIARTYIHAQLYMA